MTTYRVSVREENWGDFYVEADSAEAAEEAIRARRDEMGAKDFWLSNWHANGDFEADAEELEDEEDEDDCE